MDNNYPQKLIELYLKASSKLKKFDRVVVFKRFAPNVNDVLNDFARLASLFEEAGIYQYAAMCHLGVAKCELAAGNAVNECQALLKAARSFLRAHTTSAALQLRSHGRAYKEGALLCYTQALEKTPDDSVMKAAIINEMTPLQPHYDGTSTFSSPAHRIIELEAAAQACLEAQDFLGALQHLDDIVDNIYERKQQHLYEDLLRSTEIQRVLLLVVTNLPPGRQSPSHIQLIEYYYQLADYEENDMRRSRSPGAYVPLQMKMVLGQIVWAWLERRHDELKTAVQELQDEFLELNRGHRLVIQSIYRNVEWKV